MTVHARATTAAQQLIHEQISWNSARRPSDVAVISESGQLSYGELDERANRLANLLVRNGVGPDVLVGVCLHRSQELAVALLAVWKAGGAYVPLDPAHPADRIDWILSDTQHPIVLTQQSLVPLVEAGAARVIAVDNAPELAGCSAVAPVTDVHPENLAYVCYTSGSTGRPKGVAVRQAGIGNRVGWTVRVHRIGPADRMLHKTSLSFDAAGWEVFGPLVAGGTVVMAPVGVERDPAAMVAAVAAHRVTVLQVVPSVLRLLVAEPGWADCAALRLVFSAGEPLSAELCQQLRGLVGAAIWNTYGPTECSIDVTAHEFDPAQLTGGVSIGRPLTGISIFVLATDGSLAPIGLPGELHVGGVGLARGYLNRPGLTADRFVPDAYGPPGGRLYRTGDKVRWRADGTLEYLGRLDSQLKVNGVRIEPGEIETVLLRHPAVTGAAVLATRTAGVARIVAYLTTRQEPALGELRAFLRTRLPEYLVPSVFVLLEAFPQTASGKLDRGALPEPGAAAHTAGVERRAPSTELERQVAGVWSDLLDVTDIGADDDFFALGGYSLQLVRLAQRLRAATGREVALADLFEASTVDAQARLLQADQRPVPAVRPVGRDEPLPLSSGQARLWFLDQLAPGSAEYVVPLFLRLPAGTRPVDVRRMLDQLAARHESLRTHYPLVDGAPRQVVEPVGRTELGVVDVAAADRIEAFAAEIARGFDLAAGPVWRALLVRSPGEADVVLVTVHHIATDGWSTVILEREAHRLLAGPVESAPLPVGYADFAVWQREVWLDPARVEPQLAFWRSALSAAPALRIGTDRARPDVRDPAGAVSAFTVPAEVAGGLIELGRRLGATPFMTLLTVWHILLAKLGQEWDVSIGTPLAGRSRPELDGVVGFFLNSVVLRAGLTDDLTFEQALDRTRQTCLTAFANQDIPFERVVEELAPERDLSRTPLYQALFDLQDDGLTATAHEADAELRAAWRTTPTDLALVMHSRPDGGIDGQLEYSTALFDAATADRLGAGFGELATRLLAGPARPLHTVEVRTAADDARDGLPWNVRATPAARVVPAPTGPSGLSGPLEEAVAGIWTAAVGHDFTPHDDFFVVGGNSVLAAMVTATARADFGIDLPVSALFDGPTVRQWSDAVEQAIRADIARLTDADVVAATAQMKEQPA